MKKIGFLLIALAVCASELGAQEHTPRWISEGPYVEEASFSFELPLERFAKKLFVQVEIEGVPRRFVFDTGSPSMMSAALAADLGLKVIDTRQGRDSHGAIVASDIVQADLKLGGVTFHKVPIYAADFSSSATQCLVGDGVLGSEVLPLCAWQIDVAESALRCNSKL